MKTRTTHTSGIVDRWTHCVGVLLSAGLTSALLFVVLMGGCKEEDPGIVNVCVVPTVIRTSPANGDTNVSFNKTGTPTGGTGVAAVKIITATFSTPMNPSTITTATFTVRQGTTPIPGTVSYSDTTAVFVAPNGLGPNLIYTCTITTGAKDLAGTPLASNYVWTFTTIAPGVPILISPANGAVNQLTNPLMIWSSVPGAGTYRLQVSLSPGFVGTVYDDSTLTSTSQQMTGLIWAATYYWRVNAKVSGGTGAYSSVWSFATLAPPAPPVLVSPIAAAQNQPTSLTMSWLASTGAATYRLQVSTSSSFATTVFNDSTITGTSQPITGLTVGTIYYWRVNAKNAAGTSAYSTRSFTTIVAALLPPILVAPADGDTTTTSPTLSWLASTGAATYRLQVDTSSAFASRVFDDSTITGLSQPLAGLTAGRTYYWRVNAKNSGGTSGWSTTWRFTVAVTVPPPPGGILGTAGRFGAMGGNAGITNQGILTQVFGNLGTTAASTLITGFHDGTAPPTNVFTETPLNIGAVRDTIYTATAPPGSVPGAVAARGLLDAQTAFNFLAGLPPGPRPGAGELGGLTLAPGTYTSATTFGITSGDLTLDARGDANARFVFQVGSALTVGLAGNPRSVILINGAQPKNVFWQVGAAATINGAGGGTMVGTIIASSGVTFSTAGNVTITRLEGRALSLVASVTMVNTIINVPLP